MLTAASDECVLDFREIVEVVQMLVVSFVNQSQTVECKRFVNLFDEL